MDSASNGADDVTLLRFVNVLMRHARALAGFALLGIGAITLYLVLSGERFTSRTMFMPQSGDAAGASTLTGLAAQFGIAVPKTGSPASPQLYSALLTSPTILSVLADTVYSLGSSTPARRLEDIFDVRGENPGETRENVVRELRDRIDASVDVPTGAVRYSVTTEWPQLSFDLATRLLEQLDSFNLRTRRDRAAAERRFIEERLASSLRDLREAESALESFYTRNRAYQNDPQLVLESQRLARTVRIQEQVYTTLAANLEQVSIESSRNTPTISVIEAPFVPATPDEHPIVLLFLLGAFGGLFVGGIWAFGREHLALARTNEPETLEEFLTLRSKILRDLRYPLHSRKRPATGSGSASSIT